MTPARLEVEDRHLGTVTIPVYVQDTAGGVTRVLSGRPLPVGSDADLVAQRPDAARRAAATRVSRCNRLITGLYELSLAARPDAAGVLALGHDVPHSGHRPGVARTS